MKVILLEDVKSLGKKGDLVEVNDGYARNYILAKKLGIEATPKNMNDLKLKRAHEDKLAAQRLEDARAFAEDLKKVQVTLKIKAGEGGKLFGSISSRRSPRRRRNSWIWTSIRRSWCSQVRSRQSERQRFR